MKRREVTEDLFGSSVLILVGGTEAKAHETAKVWLATKGVGCDDLPPGESAARTWRTSEGMSAIWLSKRSPSLAAHEASHVAVSVMDWIGHEIKPGTDEPVSYYIGWLVGEALKK